jgi:hypothetical protein
MKTNPYKVGDRVRVYGWVQMHHQPYQPRYGGLAKVVWTSDQETHVEFDLANNGVKGGDLTHYKVDPKQCRKLKPRKKLREWNICLPGENSIWLPVVDTMGTFHVGDLVHTHDGDWQVREIIHVREVRRK